MISVNGLILVMQSRLGFSQRTNPLIGVCGDIKDILPVVPGPLWPSDIGIEFFTFNFKLAFYRIHDKK